MRHNKKIGHTVQTNNFSHVAVFSNHYNTIRDVMVNNNNSHATGKNRGDGGLPAFQRRGNQGRKGEFELTSNRARYSIWMVQKEREEEDSEEDSGL
jgi:hypothetical protein